MSILNVSRRSEGGGADKLAFELVKGLRSRGHRAWLAVGNRDSDDPAIIEIPDTRHNAMARAARRLRLKIAREHAHIAARSHRDTSTAGG